MILYHGSTLIVDKPAILPNQRTLDFGHGFYTTSNREQAVRWAEKVSIRRMTDKKYLSVYEFDFELAQKDLVILNFEKPDKSWLDFVCSCRRNNPPAQKYDMVFGAVADDTVYASIQLYELGVLDESETLKRLKIQKLFNQIFFHSDKSLNYCKFIEGIELGGNNNG